ncbi:DUF4232 domain-containing protein [Streptomyces sp. NPDC058291]|uniref:DUF4232 domain-containing protein n=1 Tax=Streptomyces sp. NPDC058291 TaxID=3346427 RepID=UPI0036EA8598
MRPTTLLLAALAATLLLTACGSERAGTHDGGVGARGPTSRAAVTEPAVDGVRITSVTIPSSASPSASPSAADGVTRDGVVEAEPLPTGPSADSGVSAAYEVTNSGTEALTYTVLFGFTTSGGEAVSNQKVTVRSVGPGETVRGSVRLGSLPPGAPQVTRAKVAEVTKVPAGEAPAEADTCPPSGIRVTADEGDSAMGLRVVGLLLENCGERDYTVNGYPEVSLLDEDRQPVDGVRILRGGGGIATVTGFDDPPRTVTLKPGERASADLMWRNTTGFGTAVDVPYVRVRARPGAAPVMITPHLDLGTTGKLGVSAWRTAGEQPGARGAGSP